MKRVFCTKDISKVFRNTCNKGDKLTHSFAHQCYYCSKFFAHPDKHKQHMEHCSGIPGIIYNFNNQNLVSFEHNLGYKGDLPLVAYFDFETTASTDSCFNPEQKQMSVVSYVTILAFHPKLNIDRVNIQRSVGHALKQLTTIDYLTNDPISFIDVNLVNQLKDCVSEIVRKKIRKFFSANVFS